MASSRSELEQRVTDLAVEMSKLKRKMDKLDEGAPWWEDITGTFEDDPIYEEAMKQGRRYRESLRPKPSSRSQT